MGETGKKLFGENPFIVTPSLRLSMGSISKSFPLLLIVLLAASSLILAKPAFAQTIPTPSVPTFTVQLVGPPYTVPTTYSLNQSSGQIMANIGYSNEYNAVVVTVKNQPFDAAYGTLYYNIRVKEQNETSWGYPENQIFYAFDTYPTQSTDFDYTNISIPFNAGTQEDIQVEAMLGSIGRNATLPGAPYEFVGVTSAWSNTQTVTIPANIPLSPTPTPSSSTSTITPTPTLTSVSSAFYASLLLIALFVIAFLLAIIIFLLIYMRKRKPINSSQQTVSNDGL